jgi:hypothetical protein
MDELDQQIINTYKKFNFVGKQKLYKLLQKNNVNVTMKDIDRVIDNIESYQLHKKQKPKIESHMVAFFINQIQLIDILDLQNYKSQNNQYKYILAIIDVFTRKAFCYPMKNKFASTILDHFIEHIKLNKPHMLVSDNGSEFTNNNFQKFLKNNDITHNTSAPEYHNTLGIIDAFSRYFKEKVHRYFTENNTTNWINNLKSFVDSYNNTPHSAIDDITPNDASKYQSEIREMNYQKNKSQQHTFNINDKVRKRLKKARFDKGYKIIWTSTVFTIEKINGVNATLNNGDTVKLNDLQIVSETATNKDISAIQQIAKENKIERTIQKSGVESSNIVQEKRTKKLTQKMKEHMENKK